MDLKFVYVAVLDKDCSPHYFQSLSSAQKYVWDNTPEDMKTSENWKKLTTNIEGVYAIDNIGWVDAGRIED